jgi:prepilin-type N-terminal cleavage/methylation domain-containing protein/prepilin-type processing-associated H-X9-DG protein
MEWMEARLTKGVHVNQDKTSAFSARPRPGTHRGFTLVELLVVIGIIALLISILLPTLTRARQAGNAVKCMSNLHQIGLIMQMYRLDNKDYFFVPGGWAYDLALVPPGPNHNDYNNYGLWDGLPPGPTTQIDPQSIYAYWAIAYLPYVSKEAALYTGLDGESRFKSVRSLWRCPSSTWTDPDPGGGVPYSDESKPATYGMSWFVMGYKAGIFKNSSDLIVAQDSPEQAIEGNGDLLTAWQDSYGTDQNVWNLVWTHDTLSGQWHNLSQWSTTGDTWYFKNAVHEYYRHNNGCNCLRLDGHVDRVPFSDGTNIPWQWYGGVFK